MTIYFCDRCNTQRRPAGKPDKNLSQAGARCPVCHDPLDVLSIVARHRANVIAGKVSNGLLTAEQLADEITRAIVILALHE